jgi:hypothetical protein
MAVDFGSRQERQAAKKGFVWQLGPAFFVVFVASCAKIKRQGYALAKN